ncbi:PRC-barrel domain protein [Gelidibacter sediminis]|uniref:PRC-barrel domain protein n=1 Tax=Gelidibacter sediminis TaxID=1608710 RepID=A0A4R7PLP8_9FLAO|nr:PRC-barrel domain-containing protein [Gelidibacter sediminis]TDU34470.1 PRC-barrel domain protein [Gelidibacter sediminis]
MAEHNKHLYYITELSDYKISDGYPDVRGWDVKDIDNRVIGKVDNLLVNKDAERVVYLDVEVDKSIIDSKYDPYGRPNQTDIREFVNKEGENHIIIPIGLVDINEDSDFIYTDIIDHRTFAETKRYRKGDVIDRSYENQVLGSYRRRQDYRRTDDVTHADRDHQYVEDNRVDHKSNLLHDEQRLREIIRDEIRKYHHDTDKIKTYGTAEDYYQATDGDHDQTFSNDEREMRRRRENNDVYDDDNFYERREFDDRRFNKRTPGL